MDIRGRNRKWNSGCGEPARRAANVRYVDGDRCVVAVMWVAEWWWQGMNAHLAQQVCQAYATGSQDMHIILDLQLPP